MYLKGTLSKEISPQHRVGFFSGTNEKNHCEEKGTKRPPPKGEHHMQSKDKPN
jgi:hypothetical protein